MSRLSRFFSFSFGSLVALSFWLSPLFADLDCANEEQLCRDLALIARNRACSAPPTTFYNFYGNIGYFQMPSARHKAEGTGVVGASRVPPYDNYFLGFQLFNFLELSGIYRVFTGVDDPVLSPLGFGDRSDKGMNAKITFWDALDSDYRFPSLAIGFDDFLGSKQFQSGYVVATQTLIKQNLELTLGWGWQRIKGLFGAVAFTPFAKTGNPFYKDIALVAEYDAINYKNAKWEPHPEGRTQHTHWNWGIKYGLGPYVQLSASRVRGEQWAGAISLNYNLGESNGLFTKSLDPPLYTSPLDHQPLGDLRTLKEFTSEIGFALEEQGFSLLEAHYYPSCNVLRLNVSNDTYLKEVITHERLAVLLSTLAPPNLQRIDLVLVAESIPCQEYRFRVIDLLRYSRGEICLYELQVLSSLKEVCDPCQPSVSLFERKRELIDWMIRPRLRTFFGSASGKLKYAIDAVATFEGYLGWDIYYQVVPSYTFVSSTQKVTSVDLLNPSQLLNVNSDRILYYQKRNVRFEQVYLQRAWNLGGGFYQRFGIGFFDLAYAGVCAEWLYYPLHSTWAVGLEGALLRKRSYGGFGFQDKIRRFDGIFATYVPYVVLSQGFLTFHWRPEDYPVGVKWSIGQFLARDIGVRTELFRYFKNGLQLSFWYTVTNGHDKVNGSTYYDKGISFSIPLDFFSPKSTRTRLGYAMSAWLRDVGYSIEPGKTLYNTITEERE